MFSLVLSTQGEFFDFSIFRLRPDNEEILRILSRAIDPRVGEAPKPVIILTPRYNMNEWPLPQTKVIQLATVLVRTLVMNGTVSLQPADPHIATTDEVATVLNPDVALRHLMSVGSPDGTIDAHVHALHVELDQGHRLTIPLTHLLPRQLNMTTADVDLGPEFTDVFSPQICEIIRIWELVIIAQSVKNGIPVVIFTTEHDSDRWPPTNVKIVEEAKAFIQACAHLRLRRQGPEEDYGTDRGLLHRLVPHPEDVTIREENIGLYLSLSHFFQHAIQTGESTGVSSYNPSLAEIRSIVRSDRTSVDGQELVVYGTRKPTDLLRGLIYDMELLDQDDAFTAAQPHIPGAFPITPNCPNRPNNARNLGTPAHTLPSSFTLADLSPQRSHATEVTIELEGWDRLLGLVVVVGKEALL